MNTERLGPATLALAAGVSESQRHQRLRCSSETCIRSSVPPERIIFIVIHNSGTARQHNSATCSSASVPICDGLFISLQKSNNSEPFKGNNITMVACGRLGARWCGHVGAGVSRRRIVFVTRRIGFIEAFTAHTLPACLVRRSSAGFFPVVKKTLCHGRDHLFFFSRGGGLSHGACVRVRARRMRVRGRGRVVASVPV